MTLAQSASVTTWVYYSGFTAMDNNANFNINGDQNKITSNPGNATVLSGNTASFSTSYTGNDGTMSWQYKSPGGSWTAATGGVYSTSNSGGVSTLDISNAAGLNGYAYRAVFTASPFNSDFGSFPAALTVDQPPAITSAASTTFTAGTSGAFTVTDTGFPAPTLSESGVLPSGVSFAAGTGLLSGTAAGGTGGAYSVTLTAANGISPNATQNFVLTIDQAPAFTGAATAAIACDHGYSLCLPVHGYRHASPVVQPGFGDAAKRSDAQFDRPALRHAVNGGDVHRSRGGRQRYRQCRHGELQHHRRPGAGHHQHRQHDVRPGIRQQLHGHRHGYPDADAQRIGRTAKRLDLDGRHRRAERHSGVGYRRHL